MNYRWAEGFHPPKKVTPEAAKAAIDKLKEPTPENLLEASKRDKHVLHEDLWSEGDQVWAQRGRLERCRKILGAVQEVVIVGGKEMTVRSVEFVKTSGEGRWATLETIRSDPALLEAYFAEILRLQEQATAKMAKVRELMRDTPSVAAKEAA